MNFRENLRSELDFQNLQTKELAERTGINKRTIDSYLAKNGNEPTVGNAYKIARALHVTVERLVENPAAESNAQFSDVERDLSRFSEEDVRTVRAVIKSISGKYQK